MRPLTLRLRLICNLMAGHVLLRLIININLICYVILLLILFFEIIVSIIQRVVFTLLRAIYKKEIL